jgi:O-antigen ligase
LISLLFSQNKILGLSHVWHKLPIVIVPFIVLSVFKSKQQLKKASGIFILFSLVAFCISLYRYFEINPEFFHLDTEIPKKATIIQHPYFGVYQLLALLFLIEFYRKSMNRIVFYLLFIVFSLGVLLSTSRISYILYLFIILFYVYKFLSRRNAIIITAVIISLFAVFVSTNDAIQYKFSRSLEYTTSPRLILWNNAYLVLKNSENPIFGVGIDYYNEGVKDPYWIRGYVQDTNYDHKGLKGYSSHNQYIEFILLNGVFGIFYFLLLLYTFFIAFKSKDIFIISLSLIILAFSFTETILHRQYGIILYVILMPIIFKLSKVTNRKLTKN